MKSKTKAILAYTAIFVIAFISGFLASRSIGGWGPEHRGEPRGWERGGGPGPEMRERMEQRLSRYLELEEAQEEPFFESMEEYRVDVGQAMRERRMAEHQLIREYYESFRSDLTGILDSVQLQKMDSRFHPDSVRQHRSPNRYGERGR
ncbi:hypothetical protein [Rhodohalobacter mucosus]|uniref:Uncharacterized protein n=1 Tax=Rhodohalobacter mucosus TaxID=2079485 RepID=A0A316TVA4_9BACT|nr:hypothetical protein [Rhodohalobacter mucosus]PWN06344.1 hypothetical protein DDZ15_11020 [Rhodohalobacter mucosus]